jgi:hypothetical protein
MKTANRDTTIKLIKASKRNKITIQESLNFHFGIKKMNKWFQQERIRQGMILSIDMKWLKKKTK